MICQSSRKRGISPLTSHRTVREPLNSYGSYYVVNFRLTDTLMPNGKTYLDIVK